MPFLVDGHNLIPKVGLRLETVDDEQELIGMLQAYARKARKGIEVFFDGAPAGSAGSRPYGRVTAHFVSERSTADAAIERRLKALKGDARNWTVVSSDARVLAAARASQAGFQTSEEFALSLRGADERKHPSRHDDTRERDEGLSDVELNHWLDVFKKR